MSDMIDVNELKLLSPAIFRDRKFESAEEYEKSFIKACRNYFALKDEKIKTLDASNVVNILLNFTKVIHKEYSIDGNIEHKYFIRRFDGIIYQPLTKYLLSYFVVMIDKALKPKGCDASKLYEPVLTYLSGLAFENEQNIEPFNPPPSYIYLLKNGLFNLKTKKFHEINSEPFNKIISTYHYTTKPTHSYIVSSKQNKNKRDLGKVIIDSLASGDDELKLILQQIAFATIEGRGRKIYFFLSGQAGAGKSTFGHLLCSLAGVNNFVMLNLDNIGDPNSINGISLSTHLILGDDLSKNTKLTNKAVTNYKVLVSGNALSVPVKYEPNRIIETNAVWIQMMNDDPKIYEANEAILDRTVLLRIKGKNYRRERKLDKAIAELSARIDKYIQPMGRCDEEFIDEFISEILDQVEYFEDYTIPNSVIEETEKMINEGSWAYEFVEDANARGLFNFKIIPTSHMSKFVKYYLTENNESMLIPSSQTINRELESLMKKHGYKLSSKNNMINVETLDKLDYNMKFIQDEIYNNIMLPPKSKTRYWYKDKSVITNDDHENFLKTYINKNYKELDVKEKIIAKFYIDIGDMDIISWYEVTNNT